MNQVQCVITGCAFISGAQWAACDLHDAGDHYVAVCNWRDDAVEWMPLPTHYDKTVEPVVWFERRGVFVIHKSQANLNAAAQEYIK